MARLPRGANQNESLVVEVEVDRSTLAVLSVEVNPLFEALLRLLRDALVNEPLNLVAELGRAALEESYFSPYCPAARAALVEVSDEIARYRKRRAYSPVSPRFEGGD